MNIVSIFHFSILQMTKIFVPISFQFMSNMGWIGHIFTPAISIDL